MAIGLRHDKETGVVWIRASGTLTYADFEAINWPEMAPGTVQVLDTRDVVEFELDASEIRSLARGEAREDLPVSRMAIVTGAEVAYGLARMFQILADDASYEVTVFRDVDDAVAWLDIEAPG